MLVESCGSGGGEETVGDDTTDLLKGFEDDDMLNSYIEVELRSVIASAECNRCYADPLSQLALIGRTGQSATVRVVYRFLIRLSRQGRPLRFRVGRLYIYIPVFLNNDISRRHITTTESASVQIKPW